MNPTNRILSVPASLAIGAYCLAAALLWWLFPARPRLAFGPDVQFLDMSKDGRVVAIKESAGEDPVIRVLDAETGRERCRFPGRWRGNDLGARLSPDGRIAWSAREAGGWVAREAQTGAILIDHWDSDGFEFASYGDGPIEFTEDGRALIIFRERDREGGGPSPGLDRARIEVWDLVTGGPRMIIGGGRGAAVAEGGRTLFASEVALPSLAVPIPGRGVILPARLDNAAEAGIEGWERVLVIRRRDMATGRPLSTFPGWIGPAEAFAVAPDGSELAVGNPGCAPREGKPGVPVMVRRWRLPDGRELAPIRMDPHPRSVYGRGTLINQVWYKSDGKDMQVFDCSPSCRWTWWDLRAEPPRLWDTQPGSRRSPDGRWVAEHPPYHRGNPQKPGGIRLLEHPSQREVARIGPGGIRPVGFTADSRFLLVESSSYGKQFARKVELFLFPNRQYESVAEVRVYDIEAGGRPIGRPMRSRYGMVGPIYENNLFVCRGDRGFEVWDVLAQPSSVEVFGFAAIPAIAVLLGGRWRRRRSRRRAERAAAIA